MTASEYATSRSSSYHTASECRDHSPWWTDTTERSSVDLDSSEDIEQTVNVKASSEFPIVSLDSPNSDCEPNENEEETKCEGDDESKITLVPLLPPKSQHSTEKQSTTILTCSDKTIYTIFESPTSTPSQDDDRVYENESPKVSDDNINLSDMSGLSYYYQNIITKQVLKTCL